MEDDTFEISIGDLLEDVADLRLHDSVGNLLGMVGELEDYDYSSITALQRLAARTLLEFCAEKLSGLAR